MVNHVPIKTRIRTEKHNSRIKDAKKYIGIPKEERCNV